MAVTARHIAIVGGGVGGMAAAIRLRHAGHDVTIYERNEQVGGKLATYEHEGFTFDIGPSLVTLPHVFDEVFGLAGTSLDEQVDLVRLDPQFRYFWRDGSSLTVHDRAEDSTPGIRCIRTRCRSRVAFVQRARWRHLGSRRADVLRRADVESGVAAEADALAVATCGRSTRCAP